ncbi:MAG: efflux RND transporter periplasmic adaptor subunit [Marinicella sp.]
MNTNKIKLIISLIAFSTLIGCQEEQDTPLEPTVRPIKFFGVTESSEQKTSQFPATVTAANTSELSFQVAGQIIEFDLNESDEVVEGQVVARLDDSDYRNQYNAVKAQYDNALAEYERSQNLLTQDAIAKNVVEQRKSQLDVFKAQLDTAREALDDTVLTAPYSGVVSSVAVEKFQNIQPLATVVTIINEKALEANVNIPASVLSRSPGSDIVSATITFDSVPGLELPASFKEIELAADATTQTYLVKFKFDAPTDALILPGMNGNLTVVSADKDNSSKSILVPMSSIQSSGDQSYVWLIDQSSMTVSRKDIDIRTAVGAMIPVIDGLQVDDVIAASGSAYLAEGMKVKKWIEQ